MILDKKLMPIFLNLPYEVKAFFTEMSKSIAYFNHPNPHLLTVNNFILYIVNPILIENTEGPYKFQKILQKIFVEVDKEHKIDFSNSLEYQSFLGAFFLMFENEEFFQSKRLTKFKNRVRESLLVTP